jgi:hypothetical protein
MLPSISLLTEDGLPPASSEELVHVQDRVRVDSLGHVPLPCSRRGDVVAVPVVSSQATAVSGSLFLALHAYLDDGSSPGMHAYTSRHIFAPTGLRGCVK